LRILFLAAIALLIAPTAAHAIPIGQGFKPSVALDANGTAYMAWYGPEPNVTTLQFCRLPRGATACDVRHSLTPPGTSLSRPFVVVSGATVRLVQYRYGITPAPRIFVVTSTNGGATFDAGRAAGEVPFDEAVAGPGDTLTVATNAFQGGGIVQSVPLADGSADGSAALGGSERPYNGTVGFTPDGRRVAIFATGASDAASWLHNGVGSPNNAATWGAPGGLGYADYPRLATGGLGLFLLAGDASNGMYVRRWTGDTFGTPVAVGPGDASESDITVDPGGRLHAVWSRLDAAGYHLQHSVSDDGATWRSGSVFVQTEDQVGAPRVAAAADHVGVAVWASRSGGVSQINMTAIGPDAPAVPPTQPPPVQPPPPADPAPQFNQTFVVRPVRGVVRVRLRGSNRFVNITTIDDIPFGATIDTKRGEVELRSVPSRTGAVQSVRLFDGWFRVSFGGGITNFTLNEPLARCPRRGAAAQRKPKSRKLWGNGTGRFRTTGNYSAATVRGTRWFVQDTCAGTRTRVRQGSVRVRDRIRKRTVVVRGPRGTYLARPRR